MTTHKIIVSEVAANEGGRGNLAGYKVSCTCGHVETNTMRSNVSEMVNSHLQYWAPEGPAAKAKARRSRSAKAAATRKRNADPFGFRAAGVL